MLDPKKKRKEEIKELKYSKEVLDQNITKSRNPESHFKHNRMEPDFALRALDHLDPAGPGLQRPAGCEPMLRSAVPSGAGGGEGLREAVPVPDGR